jgi:DNA-binding MarR family transcriptional regulator
MDHNLLDLETFLPYRLNRLAEAVSRDFSQLYKERFGLTRPEWRLLATLGQYGTMTATEIGAHSAMHKTKVSRAVTALEKRRWLMRDADSQDRRVERLTLTKAGDGAYRELVPLAREFERRIWDAMGVSRRANFERGLAGLEEIALGNF